MINTRFSVQGMTCSACSARVEKAVNSVPGVHSVEVNLLKNTLKAIFDAPATEAMIVEAVTRAGYGLTPINDCNRAKAAQNGIQNHLEQTDILGPIRTRLTWSLILSAVLMYISMAPMLGWPIPAMWQDVHGMSSFVLTQLLITLIVVQLNLRFFKAGFKALCSGSPNMDTLVAIGSGASVGFGIFSLYALLAATAKSDIQLMTYYSHNLYFDSAAMILALVSLGKYFEARAKAQTTNALTNLAKLVPDQARVLRAGQTIEISIDQLQPGDSVIVKTGERIPVDGDVLEGSATVDESAMTGESFPIQKKIGDSVTSATLLQSGYVVVKATRVGAETTIAQIIALVDEATSSKAPIARIADRVSAVFVPVVMGIALLAGIVWVLAGQSWEFSAIVAVSVLVISCPCALGLATPTAIMVGAGKGAESGILFKSAEAIEKMQDITMVVLDKTGTVTAGKPTLTDIVTDFDDKVSDWDAATVLHLAASVEVKSEHPLALAIVQAAQSARLSLLEVSDFEQSFGQVAARVDGHWVEVGNTTLLPENHTARGLALSLSAQAKTVLVVRVDQQVVALLAIEDPVKPDSQSAIAAMHVLGLKVMMITGDHAKTAESVAQRVGIDQVRSQVLPSEKASIVQSLQAQGHRVMMIGDGINDAPALTRADIGVAIGAGTDVAIDCADVVLVKSRLTDAVQALELSRAVMKNIRQNLFWAFFYNVIGIPVAAGVLYPVWHVLLNPMMAAAAMSLSSVSVVSNALRLRYFRPNLSSLAPDSKEIQPIPVQIKSRCKTQKPRDNQALSFDLSSTRFKAQPKLDLFNQSMIERSSGMHKIIQIDGMNCGHCTSSVQKGLEKMPGVSNVSVNLEKKCATCDVDALVTDQMLIQTITDLGFEVKSVENQ